MELATNMHHTSQECHERLMSGRAHAARMLSIDESDEHSCIRTSASLHRLQHRNYLKKGDFMESVVCGQNIFLCQLKPLDAGILLGSKMYRKEAADPAENLV